MATSAAIPLANRQPRCASVRCRHAKRLPCRMPRGGRPVSCATTGSTPSANICRSPVDTRSRRQAQSCQRIQIALHDRQVGPHHQKPVYPGLVSTTPWHRPNAGMPITGRGPTSRQVPRHHRVASSKLRDREDMFDGNIQTHLRKAQLLCRQRRKVGVGNQIRMKSDLHVCLTVEQRCPMAFETAKERRIDSLMSMIID